MRLWGREVSRATACPYRVCVKPESLQSCQTLCSPMDCSPPGSSVHGILQARTHRSGLLCPPPGHLPNAGIKPESLESPMLAGGFFTISTTWEALCVPINIIQPLFSKCFPCYNYIFNITFLTIKSTPIIMFIYTICCHLRLPVEKNFHKHKRRSTCQWGQKLHNLTLQT